MKSFSEFCEHCHAQTLILQASEAILNLNMSSEEFFNEFVKTTIDLSINEEEKNELLILQEAGFMQGLGQAARGVTNFVGNAAKNFQQGWNQNTPYTAQAAGPSSQYANLSGIYQTLITMQQNVQKAGFSILANALTNTLKAISQENLKQSQGVSQVGAGLDGSTTGYQSPAYAGM